MHNLHDLLAPVHVDMSFNAAWLWLLVSAISGFGYAKHALQTLENHGVWNKTGTMDLIKALSWNLGISGAAALVGYFMMGYSLALPGLFFAIAGTLLLSIAGTLALSKKGETMA